MYSIQDLERLSGIKAHTIRIWEKRYDLLSPNRTDTNIRYYDDNQLRKLLNTVTLIAHGGKISKVSKLSEKQISTKVELLMMPESEDEQLDVFINKILEAGLTYNTVLFESTFASASLRLGMYKCYRHVILPSLVRLGLMWGNSELMPAQEHFISNLVKRKLFAAIDGLGVSDVNAKKFLLFLPQRENHEIGLLFAHYMISKAGHNVVYLGQNVPTENVESAVQQVNPDVLVLFFVRTWHADELLPLLESIENSFSEGKTILCGNSQLLESVQQKKSIRKAHSIEDFEREI